MNALLYVRKVRFVRFIVIGGFNTAVSYSVYAFFIFLGLNYAIANLIALVFGIVVSFHTQGKFVFNNSNPKLFLRFLISWGVIYLITVCAIGLMVKVGLSAYMAGFFALPVSTALSYFFQRYFVFGRPPNSDVAYDLPPKG